MRTFLFLVPLLLIMVSCSGHPMSTPDAANSIVPSPTPQLESTTSGNACLWGMYEVSLDLDRITATAILDRHAMFAVNVVNVLNQNPTSIQFKIISNTSGSYGTVVTVDITLSHPFPGYPMLKGYDVRGVFMGNASGTLAYNSDLKYPILATDQSISGIGGNPADRPDGYTRWFNKPEFSTGGMPLFSYTQGQKAPLDYSPTATLCPYHYYADGLGASENAASWIKANPLTHGLFSSGSTNTRRFAIRFPTPETKYKFGYAVIASWKGTKPGDHPANADEAVTAEASVTKDIWFESPDNKGGSLIADFTLYSWNDLHTGLIIESTVLSSPHIFTASEIIPTVTGDNYATWHVEIPADNIQSAEDNEFWVIAEYANSDYKNDFGTGNLAGDDPLAAYFRFDLPIIKNCGLLEWAKKGGGQLIDRGRGIASLSDNSVVVTGEFSQVFCPTTYAVISATFGEDESNETTLVDPALGDVIVARYNPDGTLAWAKRAGGTGYDSGTAITALSDDSVVITGTFGSNCDGALLTATFAEGEPGQVVLKSTSPYGTFFIARYYPDGTLAWAKRAVGEPSYNNECTQRGADVVAMSDNSVIATGVFGNKATFGEGEPNETTIDYDPYYWDIFIAKYNLDGTLAWARRDGGTELEQSMSVAALSDDSFAISGWFGTQDVKPATFGDGDPNETTLYTVGMDDIFIAKYNPDNTLAWARRAGGLKRDAGYAVTALSDNSIVMGGSYGNGCTSDDCAATFGEGEPNETVLENLGWDDIFLARYNTDGTLAWAKRAAGVSQEICRGLSTLSGDMIALTGEFWEPCTFGEGEPGEIFLEPTPDTDPYYSYSDIFVAWYNPDGTVACAKSAGGISYDCSYAITSTPDDSIAITGDIEGDYGATFGKGESNEVTYYGSSYELFVARYFE